MRYKDETDQVPYTRPTNILCHHIKYGRPGDLATWFCAHLLTKTYLLQTCLWLHSFLHANISKHVMTTT